MRRKQEINIKLKNLSVHLQLTSPPHHGGAGPAPPPREVGRNAGTSSPRDPTIWSPSNRLTHNLHLIRIKKLQVFSTRHLQGIGLFVCKLSKDIILYQQSLRK